MPRGGRAAVVLAFAGSGLCLRAGAMIDTAGATWWAASAQPSAEAAISPAPFVVPTGPDGWFQPSGQNLGTEGLARFVARLALHDNEPLAITSGWGRTTGSETSDHHISHTDSWAFDLAVPGWGRPSAATEAAAGRIASALGEPGWEGGNLVKVVQGYRFQVLWLVADHYDHVHLGVRKVS